MIKYICTLFSQIEITHFKKRLNQKNGILSNFSLLEDWFYSKAPHLFFDYGGFVESVMNVTQDM